MNFIGLDVGTTGTKAIVINERGEILGKGYKEYALITSGGKVEQCADDWVSASVAAVRVAVSCIAPESIAAISVSSQGASCVALDAKNRPLANAYTWMDSRSVMETAELEQKIGCDYFYKNTGWRLSPTLDAPKIMNMKSDFAFSTAKKFYTTLEYINLFLTKNAVIDPTNASIRLLYNVVQGRWDEKILSASRIEENELAQVLPTGAFVGGLCREAANAMGISPNIPVFNGAHDQYCASIGCNAVNRGDMLLSAGTTWVIMGIGTKPLFTDSFIASAKHPVEGLYGAIASLVGSGSSMRWFKESFVGEGFAEIDKESAKRAFRDTSLCFFPYMYGPSYPYWQQDTRAAFTGILPEHDKYDFALSVMESAALSVKRAVDDFAANGCDISRLKIMGGASKSSLWCSLISNAVGFSVDVMDESDVCAVGAAAIAAAGVGAFPNLSSAASAMSPKCKALECNTDDVQRMNEKYREYNKMWKCISRYYD